MSESRRPGMPRPVVPLAVGAVGLTVIGAVQFWPVRHSMEHDLADRSDSALRSAGLPDVSATFTGQDGVLTGTVPDPTDTDRAVHVVRTLAGVRTVAAALTPTRSPSPTTSGSPTTATATSTATGTTTATGSSSVSATPTTPVTPTTPPSDTTSASPTTPEPTDSQPATGEPTPTTPAATNGQSASATSDPATASPTASAPALSAPSVDLRFDAAAGTLSLSGVVPSESARTMLVRAPESVDTHVTVDDHLLVDDSVSAAGLAGIPAVLAVFGGGSIGSLHLTWQSGQVTVSGVLPTAGDRARLLEAAGSISPGHPVQVGRLTIAAAPDSLAALRRTLRSAGTLRFATDSCQLTSADRADARTVAAALRTAVADDALDEIVLDVTGHADARGDAAYNLHLSRCRAQAVVRTLVGLGVDRSVLHVVARGEKDPVASNRTAAGRAENRRVEILLAP